MAVQLFFSLAILALGTLVVANHEIYFPSDYDKKYASPEASLASPSFETYETTAYERYLNLVISRGVSKLTLAINKALKERVNKAVNVFAPLDVTEALALILLGSNGKTFQELSSCLGLNTGVDIENKSELVHEQLGRIIRQVESTASMTFDQQINFAGAVFVQNNYPIRKVYKETAELLYQDEVVNLDFESDPQKAARYINDWVSGKTHGKIEEILSDLPSRDTKVIIASAMYFKARWERPFSPEITSRRAFYPDGRNSPTNIEVETMGTANVFPYFKDNKLGCEILGFPYQGNATVMYVVVPFNSSRQNLKKFEAQLTEIDLENLADSTVYRKVMVTFPKMKIENTINLKSILRTLGVKTLFDPSEANLGLISPGEHQPLIPTYNSESAVEPLSSFKGNPNDVIIFNRSGKALNCSKVSDPATNVTKCQDTYVGIKGQHTATNKRVGEMNSTRVERSVSTSKTKRHRNKRAVINSRDSIDSLRHLINHQSTNNNYQNPGLYADQVIHKVFIDITESGTEAAAATTITLYKSIYGINMRIDVPFLFFIRHEDTKSILFWGSVEEPIPYFSKQSAYSN